MTKLRIPNSLLWLDI